MENQPSGFKIRLGAFVAIGIGLLIAGIFIIGKQKHLFNPTFKLSTTFYSVGGLQVGNNVRFSGINVGTVDEIEIVNDTTVKVDMIIKKDVEDYIKTDCIAGIGSEGIMGDKLVIISQGSGRAPRVKDGQEIESTDPVEMDQIMYSLSVTAGNAEVITSNLADIMYKINSGQGTLGKLIQDTAIAQDLSQTMTNLKKSTKGLNENMEAAKHNFLLRGYFKKKEKEAQKKKEEEQERKEEEKKKQDK